MNPQDCDTMRARLSHPHITVPERIILIVGASSAIITLLIDLATK